MRTGKRQAGFTLVELLIVLAVMAILIVTVLVAGKAVRVQAQCRLAASTIDILIAALEQYYEFSGEFPLSCEGFGQAALAETLGGTGATITDGTYHSDFASGSALYYYLSQTPGSRRIINSISPSLVTAQGFNGVGLILTPASGETVDLFRVIDPWGKTLWYRYEAGQNFPVLSSAGPDKILSSPGPDKIVGTSDDITSVDDITSKGR
jgi:prepilin-type N-terminal cleavage/methylation domain-containing protein